ncbi:hypothetical protein, partial [Xanthomonas euvesicatoria]|uniref:hypothetical protein n=1 Tax=Xanthomonas euvesicatoria TaxID=456327 RepID=UPI0019D0A62E
IAGPKQSNGFALELGSELLTLLHRTPPCEDCPRFWVSEISGVAQLPSSGFLSSVGSAAHR